ncbi:MAG TPA: hypothetical protein VGI39_36505 [Polyangiaceae bacterium]|jgi:type IV pilus assembly protein PilA
MSPHQPSLPQAPSKRFPTWLIVLVSIGAFVFFVIPVCSVLAVYGVRKYLANAKRAEAQNALAEIARDAAAAYAQNGALCPSASHPVPSSLTFVHGVKYQSARADWEVDRPRNAGFACLQFALSEPQYFQYSYASSPDGTFAATAHGDLNGDGNVSTFVLRGAVKGGEVVIEPRIEESDPLE